MDASELDAADPLARFRDRFVLDDGDRIYVDGNSLGRPPKVTAERLAARLAEWGERLVGAWDDWIELPFEVGDLLARAALGAHPGEVVLSDSTTVNLYKLAAAALATRPGAVVTDTANFPTDRYVLEGLAAAHGRELRRFESDPVDGPTADDVHAACRHGAALVSLSHVNYRSGALADMAAITEAAHASGALVLWDLSHSAGSVDVRLEETGADLAVGCTYKYLCGGPGAPAFLYVREQLQDELRSPVWGWFGQRDQFAMGPDYEPESGIVHFLAGTPAILDLTAVQAGAELVEEAGIAAIRAKAEALTSYAVELHDAWLAPLGFELGSPRDAARRGAHVSLRHPEAWQVCRALIERAHVVPDFRGPDSIRLGLAPLATSFAEGRDALARLRDRVSVGAYREVDADPRRIT
ncbi:MAG TPA: kynureninase [Gaiellaceae bacterium]|nr:kynureninase [Gaiellaceae bacterium]